MNAPTAHGEGRKLDAHAMLEARRELFIVHGRRALLRRLLDAGEATADDVPDGCKRAQAVMPWGAFAPIILPDDDAGRVALIDAHIAGGPANVTYAPLGKRSRMVRVERLQLAALTPRTDGRCSWLALDLDGASHGATGLVDPVGAARCVAERCDALGLAEGLLVVRSRSGAGVHVWVLSGAPVPQADAALVAAYIASCARRVADRDAVDYETPHSFLTASGGLAEPGRAGAVEILPRSIERPRLGYALVLPFSSLSAERGGGVQLDVLGAGELERVPACYPARFARVLTEARRELAARQARRTPTHCPRHYRPKRRLDPRTEALLVGAAPEGTRNRALFYAVGDLLRAGRTASEAERELLDAAQRCGLSCAEAAATIRSGFCRVGGRT